MKPASSKAMMYIGRDGNTKLNNQKPNQENQKKKKRFYHLNLKIHLLAVLHYFFLPSICVTYKGDKYVPLILGHENNIYMGLLFCLLFFSSNLGAAKK